MVERELTIVNKLGLHARAAARFVNTASAFATDIRVVREGRDVSGKSIMGIMMLAAAQGNRITVRAEGADAQAAIQALTQLVSERFGEAE